MQFLHPHDRLPFERGAEHLHRLGPRVLSEFLIELGSQIGGLPATARLLAEYRNRLSSEMVRVAGGDRFPRRMSAISGGRR